MNHREARPKPSAPPKKKKEDEEGLSLLSASFLTFFFLAPFSVLTRLLLLGLQEEPAQGDLARQAGGNGLKGRRKVLKIGGGGKGSYEDEIWGWQTERKGRKWYEGEKVG
jgi:hypothetical protein